MGTFAVPIFFSSTAPINAALLPVIRTSFPAIRISLTSSRKYCFEKPLSLSSSLARKALPNAAICVEVMLLIGKAFCCRVPAISTKIASRRALSF
ncbi:hypothetical protein [Noviherbaspirillum sp. UKPF54]|uniref:hypothetical protein n=1 Tax=Noviherbaspirillum sp. UKPF54 TaxID=2601898 RepID=UPI0011B11740|nr:hypothetical protein [Noviherbaspirillum sp. UKPF54]QDZ27139.1 hypothetical protein FAY22_03720 [Noviherbaspirillum sp. UKPF54]